MMKAWKRGVWLMVLSCWAPLAVADSVPDEAKKKHADSATLLKNTGATAEEDYEAGVVAYNRGEVIEAQGIFERAANKGHADAMVRLGEILDRSGFVAEAAAWYRKSADLGNANGQFSLGAMYMDLNAYNVNNVAVEANLADARKWITLAAEQGHEQALGVMVSAYADGGLGLSKAERSNDAVLKWIRRGVDAGIPSSMDQLAVAYRTGKFGLAVDLKQADELVARSRKAQGIKEEEKKKVRKKRI